MQDGAKSTSGGLYICTDLFSPQDTIRLAKFLSETYNLKVTTPKAPGNKGALRIYISIKSLGIFKTLVLEYMHPTMLYKLGL
jgi:hypothetical protein